MEFFSQDHLAVKVPETTDGQNLKLINGVVQYKTVYYPMTAKKALEAWNVYLQDNHKLIISVVKARPIYSEPQVPAAAPVEDTRVAELEKQLAEMKALLQRQTETVKQEVPAAKKAPELATDPLGPVAVKKA